MNRNWSRSLLAFTFSFSFSVIVIVSESSRQHPARHVPSGGFFPVMCVALIDEKVYGPVVGTHVSKHSTGVRCTVYTARQTLFNFTFIEIAIFSFFVWLFVCFSRVYLLCGNKFDWVFLINVSFYLFMF